MQEAHLRSGIPCSPIPRVLSKRHLSASLSPSTTVLEAAEEKQHASVLGATGLLGISTSSSDGFWAQAGPHFTELF